MSFSLRRATLEDIPVLERLIAESGRALAREDYTSEQIEAALRGAWGVDSELIRDGTYYVVEDGGEVVACGGWSYRKTLFGGDNHGDRQSDILDPLHDAARIRAFFVHPGWARKGIATTLLQKCEEAAHARGFQRTGLIATLPGHKFYRMYGYTGDKRVTYDLGDGIRIDFIPMNKTLPPPRNPVDSVSLLP